jgi:predicted GNAT family acetyltransferase
LSENGKLVATSGVGFLNNKSFVISYVETEPEYRNKGIAKCLTSLASEPLIRKGLVGVYSTDVTNEPSLRVAEALGFIPYLDLKCFHN